MCFFIYKANCSSSLGCSLKIKHSDYVYYCCLYACRYIYINKCICTVYVQGKSILQNTKIGSVKLCMPKKKTCSGIINKFGTIDMFGTGINVVKSRLHFQVVACCFSSSLSLPEVQWIFKGILGWDFCVFLQVYWIFTLAGICFFLESDVCNVHICQVTKFSLS